MLVHDNSIFDSIREKSMKRIENLKSIIGETFKNTDHDQNLQKGSRWHDNDRAFYTACGNVINHLTKIENRNFKNRVSEKDALVFIKILTQQDLDQFFTDALLDGAKVDYWYRFEKDYE